MGLPLFDEEIGTGDEKIEEKTEGSEDGVRRSNSTTADASSETPWSGQRCLIKCVMV